MMEAQKDYLMQYLDYLEGSGEVAYLDVKEQEQRAYSVRLQQQSKITLLQHKVKEVNSSLATK